MPKALAADVDAILMTLPRLNVKQLVRVQAALSHVLMQKGATRIEEEKPAVVKVEV